MKHTRVAVVLPAYNEASVIHQVIEGVKKTFSDVPFAVDVIVVDDCSSDATSEQSLKAGAIVISHLLNTGAGGATATGLRYAEKMGYSIAATMDADGQHSADDVKHGVTLMATGKQDLLIGSRLVKPGDMSTLKRFGNIGLSLITLLLFNVKCTDSQSGLRIFSRRALEQLRWRTHGYEFASEMLWRAKQRGLTIREYPICAIYTEYSIAKGQNNWNGVNILKSLVRRRFMEIFE